MAAMGFERPAGWKETPIYFLIPTLGCFVLCLTLGIVNVLLVVDHLKDAVLLGLLVGLGFFSPVTFINAIVPVLDKPLVIAVITGSAHLIAAVLASLVIYLV